MKITTAQLKSLMASKPAVVAFKRLCAASGVKYDAIRIRVASGGSLRPDEEKALGDGLATFLKEHLGWTVTG